MRTVFPFADRPAETQESLRFAQLAGHPDACAGLHLRQTRFSAAVLSAAVHLAHSVPTPVLHANRRRRLRCGGEPVGPLVRRDAARDLAGSSRDSPQSDLALQSRLIRLSCAARVIGAPLTPAKVPHRPSQRARRTSRRVSSTTSARSRSASDRTPSIWATAARGSHSPTTHRPSDTTTDWPTTASSVETGTSMFLSAASRAAATDAFAVRVDHLAARAT